MSKFNNPYDFKPSENVEYYSPSCTVPNMAMSLQEILTRYTQGTLPNSNSFMQELPYNGGVLSPLARKGIDLCDYSSIQKEAINDVNLALQEEELRQSSIKQNEQNSLNEQVETNQTSNSE